jgi:hypothetical protein
LLNNARLPAGLRSAPAIAHGHLDLMQNPDDLLRSVFSPGHFSASLVTVSLSFPLVQNSPVTSKLGVDLFRPIGKNIIRLPVDDMEVRKFLLTG